jgi:hypothetical protein
VPEDLSGKFEEDLVALEESLNMPYVTSMERIAEARGERQRGWAAVFLGQVSRICGAVPEDVQQRLYRLPLETLAELGEALLDFQSLDDLCAWLDAHEPSAMETPFEAALAPHDSSNANWIDRVNGMALRSPSDRR